jgi:O-antigen/teichoic acid export membrane protein
MWILVTLRKQKELIAVYVTAFLFNLLANWVLLPTYHYWTAAYITGITEGIILVMLLVFVWFAWREKSAQAVVEKVERETV